MIIGLYRRFVPQKVRDYIYQAFLGDVLSILRKKKKLWILIHSKVDNTTEKREFICRAKRLLFTGTKHSTFFLSPFVDKYWQDTPIVYFDEDISLSYTIYKGQKLYWLKGMTSKTIQETQMRLLAEQDKESAHRYFGDDFNFNGKVLFDVGSAEGNIVLEHIKELKHAYLFECDEGWKEALANTFLDYQDKITIISKYVSDCTDEMNITIDDYVKLSGVVPDIIKMDIEGSEERALIGARSTLSENSVFVSCCAYHHADAEAFIVNFFNSIGYLSTVSPYYVFPSGFMESGEPYLRHGNIRAYKSSYRI